MQQDRFYSSNADQLKAKNMDSGLKTSMPKRQTHHSFAQNQILQNW